MPPSGYDGARRRRLLPEMTPIVYLCTDLLFTSKIRETARTLGREATAVRDPAQLASAARGAEVVLVDLRRPDALDALDALAREPAAAAARVFGFVDHERTDRMEEARSRGCTPLAKGKFSSELKNLLAGG